MANSTNSPYGLKFAVFSLKCLNNSFLKPVINKQKLSENQEATTMYIMEKKEKLELLHKQMITEVQDYAIILMDLDGTILSWNKGAEIIKGYKPEEIIGQNFRLFYLPKHRQELLPEQLLAQARKEGRAKHIGMRVRKNGTTFWGSILITALHDEEGHVVGYTKLTKELGENEIG